MLQFLARPAATFVMLALGIMFTAMFLHQVTGVVGLSSEHIGYVAVSFLGPLLLGWAFLYKVAFSNVTPRKLTSFAAALCLFSFYGLGSSDRIIRSATEQSEEEQIPVILKQVQVTAAELDSKFQQKYAQLSVTPTAAQLADAAQLATLAANAQACEALAHTQMPSIEGVIAETITKISALHADEELKTKIITEMKKSFEASKPLLLRVTQAQISKCEVNTKIVTLARAATPTLSAEHTLQFASQADADAYAGYIKENEGVLKEMDDVAKAMQQKAASMAKH